MAPHSAPTPPDACAPPPSSASHEAPSPTSSGQAPPAAEALDAVAQRLRYLFRRMDAKGQTHVLKKALYQYRGIELP